MERAKGFEPSAQNSKTLLKTGDFQSLQAGCTQIRAQTADSASPDLAKVVASWEKLPAPLKAAILAIIKSVEDAQ
jgi:hypothetical protein